MHTSHKIKVNLSHYFYFTYFFLKIITKYVCRLKFSLDIQRVFYAYILVPEQFISRKPFRMIFKLNLQYLQVFLDFRGFNIRDFDLTRFIINSVNRGMPVLS